MVVVNIVHLSIRGSRVRGTRKLCATFALYVENYLKLKLLKNSHL